MIQPFIVATAGHVDHGKSALVRALTGTDPDRLPEEKARGITIDLGFAHHTFPAPPGNPHGATHYSCGIIDVPGHEDFVKNMVAGVGAIDLALLLVAVDDGWMPQTEEHLQILTYLGIRSGLIVLSKADLATDLESVRQRIRSRVAHTAFADAPIVAVSALTGEGLPEFIRVAAQVLAQTPPPPDFGRPRLFVDRAFSLRGIGTVVTGTLSGGAIARGDALTVHPGNQTCRVRACHVHGHEVDRIPCGTRAALNIPELEPRRDVVGPGGVGRGDVLTLPELGSAADTLDVVIHRSPRPLRDDRPSVRPLADGARVNLLLGSAQVPARLVLLRGSPVGPGDSAIAQLRLERPLHALAQDRFILRDASEQSTLAGGQVLDPEALRHHARNTDRLRLLEACAQSSCSAADLLRLQLHRQPVGRIETFLSRARISSSTALKAVGALIAEQGAVQRGSFLAAADAWSEWLETAQRAIDDHHQRHPEALGFPLAQLRSELARGAGMAAGHEALFEDLAPRGYVVEGIHIRRATHRPALPVALRAAGERIREALAQCALDPPPRASLTAGNGAAALRFLIDSGELVDLGSDVVLPLPAFLSARRKTRELLRRRHSATTSEIRQHLGTTRRVVIPLLERLDRDGLTAREGDLRRLRIPVSVHPGVVSAEEKPFAHGNNPRKTP